MAGVKQSAVPDGTKLCTSRDEIMAAGSHEIVNRSASRPDGWAIAARIQERALTDPIEKQIRSFF